MSLFDAFRSRSRVAVRLGESTLEVEGDPELVERSLDRFLAEQRLAARAEAAQRAEEVKAAPAALPPTAEPVALPTLAHEPPRFAGAPPPVVRSGNARTWRRRGEYVRVHSIEGDIAKVYSVESKVIAGSRIARALDCKRLANVYAEDARLVRQLKGDQLTLWHRLLPHDAPPPVEVTSPGADVIPLQGLN